MKGAANLRRSNRQSRTHSGRCTVLFSGHSMRRPPGHVRKYDYGSFRTGTQRGSPTDGVSDHAREPQTPPRPRQICRARDRLGRQPRVSVPLCSSAHRATASFWCSPEAPAGFCFDLLWVEPRRHGRGLYVGVPDGNDPFSAKKAGGCSRSCSNSRKWRQRSQTN
jgi:hypothetical protein